MARDRADSVMSVTSGLDKESLVQALDTIHHTASKTQSLTAFNEYTAPPAVTSPKEGLGIAGEIQGSLSGLYTRLKETVEVVKSGQRREEEGGEEEEKLSNSTSQIQKIAAAGKRRNPSPASSKLSINREVSLSSPSSRPSKTNLVDDSVIEYPTSQAEFNHKLTGNNGGGSVRVSEISIDAKTSKDITNNPVPQGKSSDAIEALREADGRLSRLKNDNGGSGLNSEASSINILLGPGIVLNDEASSLALNDEKLNKQSSTGQRLSISGNLQHRNLTIAAAENVASSTTSVTNDEDEEALSSVGYLPLRSSKTHTTTQGSNNLLSQIRNKLLGKEYWMRDENAKDCFYCGDTFSTFRRKHHCRICGQIFDSKCTSLINGSQFGQSSTVRVCKPCEGIANGGDDSSEVSDDGSIASGFRTRLGSSTTRDLSPARSFTSLKTAKTESKQESIPSIAIPTRRLAEDHRRRSTIMEIDSEPRRPGSAKSSRPSFLQRSHPAGHRRLHSKHSLKIPPRMMEDLSPFPNAERGRHQTNRSNLPTFHSDNVIDPDLAEYLSDEDSSENEQLSLAEALHGDSYSRNGFTGFISASSSSKKRSRLGEAFIRDSDNISLSSTRLGRTRSLRNRNLSVSSNLNLRASPRSHRYSMLSQYSPLFGDNSSTTDYKNIDSPVSFDAATDLQSPRSNDHPNELSSIDLEHLHQMLGQLLTGFEVDGKGAWEKVLLPIILRASHEVVQDVQGGDDIDIRHYIKLKKIPGGRPSDSLVYSGIVFTKNLALKSMARTLQHPNILILMFPLEYARHQRHFMSLEPVIRQEKEYLQNLVHRIAALNPNLLLVERNISGLALEYLVQAGISTAYNVKRSVLEAVSRMAQTRIITSIDKLAIKPAQAGRCGAFYLKTFMYKGQKKTCMFLTGCKKELGCTIVLRGGDEEMLSKIKTITEFMIYVAYNLKLEASFLRDEFASVPPYTTRATILPDVEQPKKIKTDGDQIMIPLDGPEIIVNDGNEPDKIDIADDDIKLPDDTPMPTFYSDMMERNEDTILSCSPCVRFMQPYLVVRAREQERRLLYLRSIRDKEMDLPSDDEPTQFMLITPDMLHGTFQDASIKVREVIRAVQDAQYDKAVHNYKTQKKQWEVYASGGQDIFTPFSHQNIAILYSIVCASTSVPCKDSKVCAIGFYNEHDEEQGFERDIPLGEYIEARCLEANSICSENACDSRMLDHRHQYVHADGQLSVMIASHPPKLQGYQAIILMWSACRICGEETQVTPMSENTWKYSWGKYLELSFWGHDIHPRATDCNHDLHKDHYRYFGFKNMAVRCQYDKIALLEIVVPRTRITWKVTNDLRFKNDVFLKVEERINKFMNSVKNRLKGIRVESILPEKVESFKEEACRLKALAQEHHTFLIEKLRAKYMGSKYFEIIPFNIVIRSMEERSVEWDNIFQEFDQNYFPSEKDIRRLATLQLKKIFLDRDDSSESLLTYDEKTTSTSTTNSILTDQTTTPDDNNSMTSPSQMSSIEQNLTSSSEKIDNEEPRPDIQHLDLAVAEDKLIKIVCGQSEMILFNKEHEIITEEPETLQETSTVQDLVVEEEEEEESPQTPRPENAGRKTEFKSAIPLYRAHSQPIQDHRDGVLTPLPISSSTSQRLGFKKASTDESSQPPERKMSDRFGIGAFKASLSQSMIPRSTIGRKRDSKVSALAKHFEALSREFEREHRRDKQRATKARQSRAFPSAAAAPIIEEFRNFHEAVEETNDTHHHHHHLEGGAQQLLQQVNSSKESDLPSQEIVEDDTADDTAADTETEDPSEQQHHHDNQQTPIAESNKKVEDLSLDGESSLADDSLRESSELDAKIELPKHEKNSLMKLLTNFWAERSASGLPPLEYALNPTDHVFADSDIIVREDEPSSLIAFVLGSDAYQAKLRAINEQHADLKVPRHEKFVSDHFLTGEDQTHIERSLLQSTGTHFKYQFQEGSARMMCKVFFVEQFEAVRRKCGIDSRYIESLSRCLKWDSKGGKTKSVFLKTLDDRLVLKSLSPIETQAFVRFAPSYFTLMGEALFHDLPSVIAKMVGFYQIVIKNPITGVEFNWFLLVMENLFYDRIPTRTFDLKGSMRNRRIQPTGERNEVLLDENMVEYIFEKPLFAREHSKRLIAYSVFNDTLFLARQNVMDYSLMVAIDEDKKELVVGIIDCIRTYTWDKKLESWMKDRGKNRPTVTSPKEYKNRFRAAMDRYVLQAPTYVFFSLLPSFIFFSIANAFLSVVGINLALKQALYARIWKRKDKLNKIWMKEGIEAVFLWIQEFFSRSMR